jgi:hypothetical protein
MGICQCKYTGVRTGGKYRNKKQKKNWCYYCNHQNTGIFYFTTVQSLPSQPIPLLYATRSFCNLKRICVNEKGPSCTCKFLISKQVMKETVENRKKNINE